MSTELPKNAGGLIYKLIPKIMAEIEPIAKDKQGAGYKFRGIDDVYEAVQKILANNGVFCLPEVLEERSEERTAKSGGCLIYRILKIRYTFYAPDGSSVPAIVIGEGMDSGDKASNKAMSVGQKYAVLQTFCIPTREAKDPENETHEVAPQKGKDASPPPRPNPAKAGENISEPQAKRLFAITKQYGWSVDQVKEVLKIGWGLTSTKDIKRRDYEKICDIVSSGTPQEALASLLETETPGPSDVPPIDCGDIPF